MDRKVCSLNSKVWVLTISGGGGGGGGREGGGSLMTCQMDKMEGELLQQPAGAVTVTDGVEDLYCVSHHGAAEWPEPPKQDQSR